MRNKDYKPWIMAISLFIFLFFMMPGINSTVNLFVIPVTEELHVNRSTYSLSFIISSAAMVMASLFYEKIYKKLKAKWMIFLTGIFALLYCVISSYADNLTTIFIGSFFRGLALAFGSTAIIANVINNWFRKYQGLVMGGVFAAVGFGGTVLMPIFATWVSNGSVGWRKTYLFIGIMVLITSTLVSIFIENTPSDANTVPYGGTGGGDQETEYLSITTDSLMKNRYRTMRFFSAALIVFLLNVSLYATYAHLEAYLEQNEYSIKVIAASLGLLALGVGGGKLLYGFVSDHFGMKAMTFFAGFFQIISMVLLLTGNSKSVIIIACIILGFGIGSMQLSVSLYAGLFGKENFSKTVGFFSAELGLAWGLGPWVTGLYYDHYSNYNGVFGVFILFGIIILLLGCFIENKNDQISRN